MKKNGLMLLMLASTVNVMGADGSGQAQPAETATSVKSWRKYLCELFFMNEDLYKKTVKETHDKSTNSVQEFKRNTKEAKVISIEEINEQGPEQVLKETLDESKEVAQAISFSGHTSDGETMFRQSREKRSDDLMHLGIEKCQIRKLNQDSSTLGHNITSLGVGALCTGAAFVYGKHLTPEWNSYTIAASMALVFLSTGSTAKCILRLRHKTNMSSIDAGLRNTFPNAFN